MNMAFYIGTAGAKSSSDKLSVSANNLANINNHGFRPKTAAFSELVNRNLKDSEETQTGLQTGSGVRLSKTATDFQAGGITQTGALTDYALLEGNTFFMLQDPASGEITFTRSGRFHIGQAEDGYYLMSESGKYVLDEDGEPFEAEVPDVEAMASEDYEEEDEEETDPEDLPKVGVYTFANPSRMASRGDNEYQAPDGEEPVLVENPKLMTGALETSGTDLVKEMTRIIESQRAYSFALKMVQTSDEIEGTINSLRG